jgi:dienelactone hydrolase
MSSVQVLIDKPSRPGMPDGFCIFQEHFLSHAHTPSWSHGDTNMSQNTEQDHISKKRVVYTIPGMDAVTVRRNEPYRETDTGALTMDLYYPPDSRSAGNPAVVFVTGFSDIGAEKMLGCKLKEMGSYTSWAQLVAASGLVGITYANREPAADAGAVLQHIRGNARSLEIDENRIGVWACSGSGPTALSVLIESGHDSSVKCAVFCYPYTLDLDRSTRVADAAGQFGFVNPCAGKTANDLPRDVPLFFARAGQDRMPGLNEALDRFLGNAMRENLPITFVNHPAAPHAFDLFDNSESSREIIKRILTFFQFHLRVADR